ncbi:MAG: hypothetical protein ACKPEN_14795 [Planktothrix sp.]
MYHDYSNLKQQLPQEQAKLAQLQWQNESGDRPEKQQRFGLRSVIT